MHRDAGRQGLPTLDLLEALVERLVLACPCRGRRRGPRRWPAPGPGPGSRAPGRHRPPPERSSARLVGFLPLVSGLSRTLGDRAGSRTSGRAWRAWRAALLRAAAGCPAVAVGAPASAARRSAVASARRERWPGAGSVRHANIDSSPGKTTRLASHVAGRALARHVDAEEPVAGLEPDGRRGAGRVEHDVVGGEVGELGHLLRVGVGVGLAATGGEQRLEAGPPRVVVELGLRPAVEDGGRRVDDLVPLGGVDLGDGDVLAGAACAPCRSRRRRRRPAGRRRRAGR